MDWNKAWAFWKIIKVQSHKHEHTKKFFCFNASKIFQVYYWSLREKVYIGTYQTQSNYNPATNQPSIPFYSKIVKVGWNCKTNMADRKRNL